MLRFTHVEGGRGSHNPWVAGSSPARPTARTCRSGPVFYSGPEDLDRSRRLDHRPEDQQARPTAGPAKSSTMTSSACGPVQALVRCLSSGVASWRLVTAESGARLRGWCKPQRSVARGGTLTLAALRARGPAWLIRRVQDDCPMTSGRLSAVRRTASHPIVSPRLGRLAADTGAGAPGIDALLDSGAAKPRLDGRAPGRTPSPEVGRRDPRPCGDGCEAVFRRLACSTVFGHDHK